MASLSLLRPSSCSVSSDTFLQSPCRHPSECRAETFSSLTSYGGAQLRVCRTQCTGMQWRDRCANRRPFGIHASTHASIGVHPGTEIGADIHGPAVLEDVPHLTDYLPDLPTYSSPLNHNPAYATGRHYFVGSDDVVARNVVTSLQSPGDGTHFRRAGPREKVYFKPEEIRACVVTCGGLCPGLNTVIREIVCGLWNQYGVRDIIGIEGGYRGFYARNTLPLNPKVVNDIHKRGGTILGTSRGGHDTTKIVSSIEDRGINQVYIIGGDGTQKGAAVIYEEVRRRGLKVAVTGIPKTIDNDIAVIDRSFGFDTAVEEAQRAINAAHTEAESVHNGIGLVKLMGRYSGECDMASLANVLCLKDLSCLCVFYALSVTRVTVCIYKYGDIRKQSTHERCIHESDRASPQSRRTQENNHKWNMQELMCDAHSLEVQCACNLKPIYALWMHMKLIELADLSPSH